MIADFKKGASGILPGFEKFGDMLKSIVPLITVCKKCPAEVKQGFATLKDDFTSPTTIAKMLLQAVEHIGKLTTDIKSVVSDFGSKNFSQMGKDLGAAVSILEVESELIDVHSIAKDMGQLLQGLFAEAFQKEIPDLEGCVKDGEALEADVKAMISDFTHKKFADGFKAISDLVSKVTPSIADCKQTGGELKKELLILKNNVTDIKRDEKILLDLVLHHLEELLQDITAIKKDFTAHNYYNIGTDIGKILVLLQLP